MEAKRNFNSGNFESIDLTQLDRILGQLPYSHLLLFTHKSTEHQLKFPNEFTWSSHMWVSPINTSRQLLQQTGNDNWKVIRTSFPFTMFLTSRIFWGLDLDFRQDIIDDLILGINKIVNPSFLGIVNVFYDGQRPVEIKMSDLWQRI